MSFMRNRKLLNVFIGSPGDLQDERETTRQVIDRVNRHLARNLGVSVELRGWEDTLPGHARPQELINRDIEDCDLFLGLVWKRWGTPTGEYSSGFEEEFRLAESLIEAKKISEVWLFFKDIDASLLEDPGEQVQQVLRFKRQVAKERRFLYKQFASTADWSDLLYDSLADYLTRLPSESESGGAVAEYKGAPRPPIGESVEEFAELTNLAQQLTDALQTNSLAEFDRQQRSRMLLFVTSLFQGPVILPEPIGTHELQALYQQGSEFRLLPVEQHIVARTLIGDKHNTGAGWRWLRDVSPTKLLGYIACNDNDSDTRLQALKLMGPIITEVGSDVLANVVQDADENVRTTCLELLDEHGKQSHMAIIESALEDEVAKTQQHAWTAKLGVLSRCAPNDAIEYALDTTSPVRGAISSSFARIVKDADEDTVTRLLKSDDEALILCAIHSGGHQIGKDALIELTKSDSESIGMAALKLSIERFPDDLDFQIASEALTAAIHKSDSYLGMFQRKSYEEMFVRLYQTLPSAELQAGIEWFGLDGPRRYEAMAKNDFATMGDVVRQDIVSDFERIRSGTIQKLPSPIPKQLADLDGFIRAHYLDASMRALALHSTESDVEIAKHVLQQQSDHIVARDAVDTALDIIKAHGSASDIDTLMTLVATVQPYESARTRAAQLALELNTSPDRNVPHELLKQGDEHIIPIVIRDALRKPDSLESDEICEFLYHEQQSVREMAACVLALQYDEPALVSLLGEYSDKGQYYYNVTCWFDRWLFAPEPLRANFRRTLMGKCEIQCPPTVSDSR